MRRFRAGLERRGYIILPLQSPEVRTRLNLPADDLLIEMRVVTPEGRVFGGADAIIFLTRSLSVPLYILTRIPGAKPLMRFVYRIVARNRTCAAGSCAVRLEKTFVGNLVDWLPLLVLVTAAAVIGRLFAPWLWMWSMALAMFAGCKWLCLRKEIARGMNITPAMKIAFLLGWVGMDAKAFADERKTPAQPRVTEWIFAALKILVGAAFTWMFARRALAVNSLLTGWLGMFGLILMLHFGIFHLTALIWRSAGVPVTPLMRAPLLSHSLGEFWSERWNTAFHQLAGRFLFRPVLRNTSASAATMLVFLASGLIHDLLLSVPARGGYGLPTLYFLLQGIGILFEHGPLARKIGLNRRFRGWLFMAIFTAGPAFWLFHPVFVRNVILPFLHWIGAT